MTRPSPADGGPHRVGPMIDTRVLKHHTDAAVRAIGDLLGIEVDRPTAEELVARILSAGDSSRPRYCIVLVTEGSRSVLTLGPFATPLAAQKAMDRGLPIAGRAGLRALVPWPRLEPTPTTRNRRTA